MQENISLGMTFVVLAGIFAGAFALPMKFTTGWKWQHNWLVYATWAMLILPVIFGFISAPWILKIYEQSDGLVMLKVFLFGMAWGVGVICFGLGIDYLGVALGLSIMLGLMISLGALMPIIIYQPEELFTPQGYDIMIASLLILSGIIICSVAGSMRDRSANIERKSIDQNRFTRGLIIAILAGLLGMMQNVGFVTGKPMQDIAISSGVNPVFSGNVVWPVLMAGCFLINLLYCGYLITKNKEWTLFGSVKSWYWPVVALSGIMWFLCMFFFGMAASKLGKLGPSIGWASFQTLAIITGNIVGFITGEWKNSLKVARMLNFTGIVIMVAGIIVIAF